MKVAVFGSRSYPHLEDVDSFVSVLYDKYPHAIVVSGGARGVDGRAEQVALSRDGEVISFRPRAVGNEFVIKRWDLGPTCRITRDFTDPTFADFASAATYRDLLIADEAEIGVCFWDGRSHGAGMTRDFIARWEGKPLYTYDLKDRFAA